MKLESISFFEQLEKCMIVAMNSRKSSKNVERPNLSTQTLRFSFQGLTRLETWSHGNLLCSPGKMTQCHNIRKTMLIWQTNRVHLILSFIVHIVFVRSLSSMWVRIVDSKCLDMSTMFSACYHFSPSSCKAWISMIRSVSVGDRYIC